MGSAAAQSTRAKKQAKQVEYDAREIVERRYTRLDGVGGCFCFGREWEMFWWMVEGWWLLIWLNVEEG